MKIRNAQTSTPEDAPRALFSRGGTVFKRLSGVPETAQVEVYRVDFPPGARTRVHVHTVDQILIGVQGRGYVADAGGEQVLEVGDTVTIPADHPHWHGAGPDGAFAHITVAVPGDRIEIVDGDARGAWGALPEGG